MACLVAMLAVFTAVYASHLLAGASPACGCFGRLMEHLRGEALAPWLIGRNLALMLLGVLSIMWTFPHASTTSPAQSGGPAECPEGGGPSRVGRAGFTAIELIVVIAVIAVLVSIVLPALAAVRSRAARVQNQSNLRQHGAVFSMYHGDWSETFPLFMDPSVPRSEIQWASRGIAVRAPYFMANELWPIALADQYYQGQILPGVFVTPRHAGGGPLDERGSPTSYWYPCAFVAAPEFYSPETRQSDPRGQLGPTRLGMVRWPSDKFLLVEAWTHLVALSPGENTRERVSGIMVDGAVRDVEFDQVSPSTVNGDGNPATPWSLHSWHFPVAHHTPDGVRGRDLAGR